MNERKQLITVLKKFMKKEVNEMTELCEYWSRLAGGDNDIGHICNKNHPENISIDEIHKRIDLAQSCGGLVRMCHTQK